MLSIQTLAPSASVRRLVPSAVVRAAAGSVAVLGLAHLALLALQARLTWGHPHYRFFPVLLVGAGVIAARAVSNLGQLNPGADRPARWMLGSAWALLVGACLIGSPWLGTVATMLATLGVAFAMGGAGCSDRCCRPGACSGWRSHPPTDWTTSWSACFRPRLPAGVVACSTCSASFISAKGM